MIRLFTKNQLVVTIFFTILVTTLSGIVFAQETSGVNSQDSRVSFVLSPSNPKPNENVSIFVSGVSVNLDSSKIQWYVDGILKKEGVGEKEINIQTKNSGNTTNVKITITTPGGETIEKNVEINPSQIDLIIEASSYTPPFYKGRSYFVSQGKAKIIAVPNIVIDGKKLNVKELNFRWKKDSIILGSSSGVGKNTLVIDGGIPIKDIDIELEILDSSKNVLAEESIMVSPSDPKIIFYENSPLYGILYNKAIPENYSLGNREELKIVAEPYFFDISGIDGNDSKFQWSVNGKSVSLNEKKNELLLRQENSGVKGISSISLQIENLVRIFQYAGSGFNVEFGE
jgi:hypothetical protein